MLADTLIAVKDFSRYPAGRYSGDGNFSGQRFRDERLLPAVRAANANKGKVTVLLDGASAYSSSFLEEAFGGLIRTEPTLARFILDNVSVRADGIEYQAAKADAERYIRDAAKAASGGLMDRLRRG